MICNISYNTLFCHKFLLHENLRENIYNIFESVYKIFILGHAFHQDCSKDKKINQNVLS